MNTQEIENSIQSKVVVIREGSRGWRLGACFVDDALSLLGGKVNATEYEIPDESDEEYSEIVKDMSDDLEDLISQDGYSVVWDDGYVIYKDLTDEEAEYLYA